MTPEQEFFEKLVKIHQEHDIEVKKIERNYVIKMCIIALIILLHF